MITFKHRGNFKNTEKLLSANLWSKTRRVLELYGHQGVVALSSATPKDSGITADSWDFDVSVTRRGYSIVWTNSSVNEGIPIVILLQYGHGTGNGGYVEGRDFVNPAIQPIFDKIAKNLWEEVSKL